MPFVIKKFPSIKGKKIQVFLMQDTPLNMSSSQKLLAGGRVLDEEGNRYQNGQKVKGDFVQVVLFEGYTKGLNPLFETDDFAFFDKPSGIMVHPISRYTKYTLLDEIRYHFGDNANLAHRIDQETSGLVLVSKHKLSDIYLKMMFESKKYQKTYQAIVCGKITNNITINSPISKENGAIGVRMKVCKNGKASTTHIKPIKYYKEKNQTLIEAIPITGRQHQIRVHAHSIGHPIVGDPIYGVDDKIADAYLSKTLSLEDRIKYIGYERLMLHSYNLKFTYNNRTYNIFSKQSFGYNL